MATLNSGHDFIEADPFWYLSEDIVGIVMYVDLFSDNLPGLRNQIPYFEKLLTINAESVWLAIDSLSFP